MKKFLVCMMTVALLGLTACNSNQDAPDATPTTAPTVAPTSAPSSNVEVLTAEEIKFFNEEFFSTETAFPGKWIRNNILYHEFSGPAQVNIEAMFYSENGAEGGLTDDEKAFLDAQGAPDLDTVKLTSAYLEEMLNFYVGLPLDATEKRGLDKLYYYEAQDAYYMVHSDALCVFVQVEEGWRSNSGAVSLFYRRAQEPIANMTAEQIAELPRYMVVLLPTDTGYQFLANQKLVE